MAVPRLVTEHVKIKLKIERKLEPPPLEPFDCAVCEQEIERDPYQPEWQCPPVCVQCSWESRPRGKISQLSYSQQNNFLRAHSLLTALDEEIKHARRTHRYG